MLGSLFSLTPKAQRGAILPELRAVHELSKHSIKEGPTLLDRAREAVRRPSTCQHSRSKTGFLIGPPLHTPRDPAPTLVRDV